MPSNDFTNSLPKHRFRSLRIALICVKSELTQYRGVFCYGWRKQN